ncbi:MAG: ABC transporter permease [Acidimicrobiales bacterium]
MTETTNVDVVVARETSMPRTRAAVRALWRLPISVKIGIVIVGLFVLCAILAPLITQNPYALNFAKILTPPSWSHPFGTDENGRDLFSRCLYGLRLDLVVVAFVTYISLPIGLVLGAAGAYFGGKFDAIVARVADVAISFPFIVLVIAIVAITGPGLKGIVIGVPSVSWALYARLARSQMLVIRELPFMEAAVVLGYSKWRIIFRHGIPNLVRNLLVFSTIDVMGNFLLLAGLSYLGIGVQPPTPELGAIIAEGQPYLLQAWWITTLPGLLIVFFGLGIGLIGEGLSDRRVG